MQRLKSSLVTAHSSMRFSALDLRSHSNSSYLVCNEPLPSTERPSNRLEFFGHFLWKPFLTLPFLGSTVEYLLPQNQRNWLFGDGGDIHDNHYCDHQPTRPDSRKKVCQNTSFCRQREGVTDLQMDGQKKGVRDRKSAWMKSLNIGFLAPILRNI